MNKVFSAKFVYKNFWNYLSGRLFDKKFLLIICGGPLAILSMGLVIKRLLFLLEGREFTFQSEFANILLLYSISVPILMGVALVTAFVMWQQEFSIENGRLIDKFPIKKSLEVRDIERIVLFSPKLAHLMVRKSENDLFTCLYWHGTQESDWMDFLSLDEY